MNEEMKKKLEEAIIWCATRAVEVSASPKDTLEWTQAAVNASNVLIGLSCEARQPKA